MSILPKRVSEINTSNVFNKYKKIKAYYEGEQETTSFILLVTCMEWHLVITHPLLIYSDYNLAHYFFSLLTMINVI